MDTTQTDPDASAPNPPRFPFLKDPRFRVPVIFMVAVMVLLSLERVAILIAMSERFADVTVMDFIRSFMVGWRFDLVICCMVTVPLVFVAAAPTKLLLNRGYQYIVAGYCSLVLSLMFFLCIIDFFFFGQFGERLNHKAFVYLEYDYIYRIIWDEYPVIGAFVLMFALLGVMLWVMKRLAFIGSYRLNKRAEPPQPVLSPSWRKVAGWVAFLVVLMAVCIRGSFGPKTLNTGPAYFTSSVPLAQLTLNGLYTLRESIISVVFRHKDLADYFDLLPSDQATTITLNRLRRDNDEFVNDPANPLRRITHTGREQKDYNVVLVIMESLSWHYISEMGGEKNLTPNLDAIIADGVLMDRCFAVGGRTTRGFSGIVSGYPDLPGKSVTTRIESEGNFLTLGTVLRRRDYETMFIYAGQPYDDHHQSFLGSNGYSRQVFPDQFTSLSFRTHLGYCDGDLFDQANREFVAMQGRPFFATLMTLSFHKDYHVPPDTITLTDADVENRVQKDCIRYADWAIGQFIQNARKEKYFEKTIFVFVADHMGGYREHPNTPASFRVPFIIYAPTIISPRRVSTICSQMDIAGTIMSLLGGDYEHCFFGSNVLDLPPEDGRAFIYFGSQLVWIDGNGDIVTIPFNSSPRLFKYVPPGSVQPQEVTDPNTRARRDELARQVIAMIQTAQKLAQSGSYNLHQRGTGSE